MFSPSTLRTVFDSHVGFEQRVQEIFIIDSTGISLASSCLLCIDRAQCNGKIGGCWMCKIVQRDHVKSQVQMVPARRRQITKRIYLKYGSVLYPGIFFFHKFTRVCKGLMSSIVETSSLWRGLWTWPPWVICAPAFNHKLKKFCIYREFS